MTQSATYTGPPCGWNVVPGDRALVLPGKTPDVVLAQFHAFEKRAARQDLAFGWRQFPAEHFKVDEQ